MPAPAQIAGSLTVQNEYRFRGYSISGGKPAVTLALSYDHPSGFYLNGSAIGALDRGNAPVLLGAIGNIGYARRVGGVSLDAGVTRTQYYHSVTATNGDAHYTEFYGGVLVHGVAAHLYVSPDYFGLRSTTLYGEIEGALKPVHGWRLTGHVGALGYVETPRYRSYRTRYDWRVGIGRMLGPLDVHAALTGGGPGYDRYFGHDHSRTALVGGVSFLF